MQTKTSTTIGFIGLGLIGGSIAKAIRQYYPDYQILAFDKSRETLALAMQDGTIDISCTAIDEQFSHCSYLFLCAPISYNNAYLSQLKDLIHGKPGHCCQKYLLTLSCLKIASLPSGLHPDRCRQCKDCDP